MKNFLLCFFIVMSGAMTATTIKNSVAGPTAVSLTVVNSACGAADGSVTIGTVTGGVAPYSYAFNGSAYTGTANYPGLVAGTYTLDVKDANGDIYSTNVTIIDNPGPTAIATTTVDETCGASNGSVTLGAVTGGTAPYTYSFNGTGGYSAVTNYSGLAAGAYQIDVKDANGCIYSTTVTVFDATPTALASTIVDESCGASDGSITLGTVTGGTAPYTYDFNGSGYQSITSYTGLPAGTYTINVKDANGCIFTTSISLTDNPATPPIANVTQPTCAVITGTIVISTQAGAEYSIDGGTIYQPSNTFSNLSPGTYTLWIRKTANPSCIAGGSTVTIDPIPTAPTTPTVANEIQPTCATPTGTIVFNSQAGVQYSLNGITYQASTTFAGLNPGTYTLVVRSISDGTCQTSGATITINVAPGSPATPTIASVTQPTCAVPSGTIVFTAQFGVEYSIDGIAYQPSTTFSNVGPGTYSLSVRNTGDSCTATAANTVTINAIPTAPATPTIANITQPTCAVPTGTIVITAQTGVEYTINGGSSYHAGATFTGLVPGTYTVRVRSINDNTCSTSAASTVIINAVPSAPATPTIASVTQPTCGTPSGTIVFTSQGGVQYSINGAAYQASPTFSGVAPGTYTLIVRSNSETTCQSSGATVTINSAPTAPTAVATTITDAGCGLSDGSITITGVTDGTAPHTYNFNSAGFSGTTTYSALAVGSYPLIVKDANGCTFTTSITVNNSGAATSIATTIVNSNCGASDGSVTLGTVNGGTPGYTYSFDGSPFTSTTSYGSLAAGSYSIIVKDANGCLFNTAVTVSNNAGPTAVAFTTVNATCGNANGTISLGAVTGGTPPYTYSFNGSGFSPTTTFSGLPAGSYPINVRDANGCMFTTTATIIDSPGPTAIAITVVDASCGNSNGSITLGTTTGGTAPYIYSFNGGGFGTTTSYTGLAAGGYSIEVKDANGCIYNTFVSVLNTTNSGTATISYAGSTFSTSQTSPQPVTLTGTGNFTGGTYSTSAGLLLNATTGAITPNGSTPGCYTVTYTVPPSGGCSTFSATTSICITTATDGISLIAFIDTNSNGVKDGGEANYNGGQFHYELNNDGTIHNIYSSNGTYTIFDSNATNSYDVSFTTDNPNYTVNPSSYSNITIANGSGITTYNFPITAVGYTDLKVFITPISGPVPGFTYYNYVYVQNTGSLTTPSGTVTYTKDSRLTISSVSPSVNMNATGFTYNYPSLAPNQYVYLFVTLQVPTIPTVQLGDLITNTASIDVPAGDINPSNNNYSLTQVVKGSYDPNDKVESHGPQIVHSTFSSTDNLNYTIQFENTGTADAITVKVNDLLDAMLDENSIKMIDASHNYTLDRVGNDLTWTFNNINLPPSVAGTTTGKGYINFQVKPKPGYVIGDIINNTAYIYFDFNPAIVTNTFSTEFVTALGVQGFVNSQFSAYPNPTTGIITIALKNSAGIIDTITVTDVLGKNVLSNSVHNANTTVDISHLTKGLYFVKIQAEGQVKTLKVVKE